MDKCSNNGRICQVVSRIIFIVRRTSRYVVIWGWWPITDYAGLGVQAVDRVIQGSGVLHDVDGVIFWCGG